KRPEAGAIEGGADDESVAERERGRAVPRLETDGLVAVEVAHRRGQVAAAFPSVGHKAHQRLADLPSTMHQQLEGVVERRGIRSFRPDRAAQIRFELSL